MGSQLSCKEKKVAGLVEEVVVELELKLEKEKLANVFGRSCPTVRGRKQVMGGEGRGNSEGFDEKVI